MGQVSEDINNGLLCLECGQWMEDVWPDDGPANDKMFKSPPGYPRKCSECCEESAVEHGQAKSCGTFGQCDPEHQKKCGVDCFFYTPAG